MPNEYMFSEDDIDESNKRLLIASDIHGSVKCALFLKQCIEKHSPDGLILLGDYLDYCSHSPSILHRPILHRSSDKQQNSKPDELTNIINVYGQYDLPTIALRGNCDSESVCEILPFYLLDSAWIYSDNLRIFACHGHNIPYLPPETVVLGGHTHEPRAETIGDIHYWNPGSIAFPRNGSAPSYGLYEHGVFSVIHINGTIIMQHKPAKHS